MTRGDRRTRPRDVTKIAGVGQRLQIESKIGDRHVASGENDGLPDSGHKTPRVRKIENRQPAIVASRRVRTEHRQAVRALDELHRGAPPRVDLGRVRDAVANDEVDAIDADEAELFSNPGGETPCRAEEIIVFAGGRQDVPAVSKSGNAERVFADQLARYANRNNLPAARHEHDRGWHAVDTFLKVTAGRYIVAIVPR